MKPLNDFINKFKTKIDFKSLIVRKRGRYYLLNENLKQLISKDFFYAGVYLGKVKGRIFFPSFNLLEILSKGKANKIVVGNKTEWLFICGRDIFKQGVIEIMGSKRKGAYTLILNRYNECLGFGRILCDIDETLAGHRVVVKNVLDVGDFLRREKK